MFVARPRAHRAGKLARYTLAGLMLLAPTTIGSVTAQADDSTLVTISGLFKPSLIRPGYVANGTPYASNIGLYVDRASRSLISLDNGTPAYAAAYDEITLRPRAGSGHLLDGAITAVLSDPRVPGVIVALSTAPRQPATTIEHVQIVHGHVTVTQRLNVTSSFSTGKQTITGLAYDPVTTMIAAVSVQYVTGRANAYQSTPTPGTVDLTMIDLGGGKVAWQQTLPDCNLPMELDAQPASPIFPGVPVGVVRSPRVIDIGCSAQSDDFGSGAGRKAPIPLGVGIVALSGSGKSTTYGGFNLAPYPGDDTSAPMGVWIPNTQRMAIQVTNTQDGSGWAIFDGAHSNYVGTVPIHLTAAAAGFDPQHGRLYLLDSDTGSGLVMSDTAVTPADQGHSLTSYAHDPIDEDNDYGSAPRGGVLPVDPATGRIFLLYGGAGSDTFIVAHDNLPYYSPPPPPNVDAATAGIPEVDGQTDANYSGTALGYGSIIRQDGGESNLFFNYVPFGKPSELKSTRELDTSYLSTGLLDNSSARVALVTAAPDRENTQSEMGDATQGNASWPYAPVQCADFGSGHKTIAGTGGTVTCDATNATVSGSITSGSSSDAVPNPFPYPSQTPSQISDNQPPTAPNVIAVGGSELSVSSSRQIGKGITTKVKATASGISVLGGVLRIGKVSIEATAAANGQTGGATSGFTRTVQYVSLNDKELCTTGCNLDTIAKQINAELVGRARVSFPSADASQTIKGSPGGYQAVVRRDPFSQAEEVALNDQDPTHAEVPGMEITIFEDNTEASRTIVYLAGAEVQAHYGVYTLDSSCSGCNPQTVTNLPTTTTGPVPPTLPNGGTGTQPTAQGGTQPVVAGGANLGAFLKHGWQLLFAGLGTALRQFGVWAILLLPIYLSARRWALANRHDTTGGPA